MAFCRVQDSVKGGGEGELLYRKQIINNLWGNDVEHEQCCDKDAKGKEEDVESWCALRQARCWVGNQVGHDEGHNERR